MNAAIDIVLTLIITAAAFVWLLLRFTGAILKKETSESASCTRCSCSTVKKGIQSKHGVPS